TRHPCSHFVPSTFFFHDPATTEIYTLSLHDALPISSSTGVTAVGGATAPTRGTLSLVDSSINTLTINAATGNALTLGGANSGERSEEHTSELQSLTNLVCRLLLEKKKTAEQLTRTPA